MSWFKDNFPIGHTIKEELMDPRFGSNIKGMLTGKSREERIAAHADLDKSKFRDVYNPPEGAEDWDKKIAKVELENDLSTLSDDDLDELANWYKYPSGNRYIDSERHQEYSNRVWREIEKRKNPFTKDLPSGDSMGPGDFRE
jgi:hypothetical protein